MSQSTPPKPRPEGELIQAALKASRMSARKAAGLAGMSDARWRQIVNGFLAVSGTQVPVKAPAETLARMAKVVGVTPEQLHDAGRADAAEELRELAAAAPPAAQPFAEGAHIDAIAALLATLPPEVQEEVLRRATLARPYAPPSNEDVRRAG